jgi:FtsH-binding integral membrane protein
MEAPYQPIDNDVSASGDGAGKTREELAGIGEAAIKMGFKRKVYGLLTMQMALTVLICFAFMFFTPLRHACVSLVQSGSAMWVNVGVLIPTMCVLCCLSANKSNFPTNLGLLAVFTVLMSMDVGFICALFYESGRGIMIAQAFGLTLTIFIGLTAYVMISKKDFSYLGGFLTMALCGLIMASIVSIFFQTPVSRVLISFVGAVIFSLYIIYDTWRLEKQLGPDDYIIATIELYLDIINLFLYILQLLASGDR